MSAHLSDEQLTRYLSGSEDARLMAHLDECDSCRTQAGRLLELVGAVRAHAERSGELPPAYWSRQRTSVRDSMLHRRTPRPKWALAAAFALLVFASTFLFHTQAPRFPLTPIAPTTGVETTSISDDALLSAIDSTLEQDVPAAFAPVQQLAYEREQAERQATRKN